MRVVIAPGSFEGTLSAIEAARAIAAGWHRVAPTDRLYELPLTDGVPGLDAALGDADLVLTGEGSFDWQSLRDTLMTAVAQAAASRGVPCLVLAGQVSVGRREAGAIGVDEAYSVAEHAGSIGASMADPAGTLAALAAELASAWSGSR